MPYAIDILFMFMDLQYVNTPKLMNFTHFIILEEKNSITHAHNILL